MGTTKIKENRFIALPNRRDRVGLQLLKESLAANGKPTYNQFVFEFMLKATLEHLYRLGQEAASADERGEGTSQETETEDAVQDNQPEASGPDGGAGEDGPAVEERVSIHDDEDGTSAGDTEEAGPSPS